MSQPASVPQLFLSLGRGSVVLPQQPPPQQQGWLAQEWGVHSQRLSPARVQLRQIQRQGGGLESSPGV